MTKFFLHAFLAAISFGAVEATPSSHLKSGKSGKQGKGKGSKQEFQSDTRSQPFTPNLMFAIGVDRSSAVAFVTDPGAYVYQVANLFGDGVADGGDYCNSIGCLYDYVRFATKGRKKSDTEWSVNLFSTTFAGMHISCPLPTMTPSVPFITCADPDDYQFGLTLAARIANLEGPTADGISTSPGFFDTCDETNLGFTYEFVCEGSEEDIAMIEKSDPKDSLGFGNRPYTDAAIMMYHDGSGERSFWSGDAEKTSFEQVDFQEKGSSGGCNTYACTQILRVIVYLRGPDPNFAFIESNDIRGDMKFLCPEAGQTITLTATCDGSTNLATDFVPKYYAESYAVADSFSCPDSKQEGLLIECSMP